MNYTKDLVFFDKSGNGYGFDYDADKNIWNGTILLDPVSEGLFETEKIIIMQKYVLLEESENQDMSNSVKTYAYGYPSTIFPDSPDGYVFKWDNDIREVDEINLFSFDRHICPPEDTSALTYREYDCPNIIFLSDVAVNNLKHEPIDYVGHDDDPGQGIYRVRYQKNSRFSPSYAEINICFCDVDDEYSTFRRDLHMYYVIGDTETLVGKFTVVAKSIEEDERLSTMCSNLGYNINNIDFSIFQDSDIKEQLIDHELMNLKRKEMLMEGHNIYSYIGSYKSLINAIRFFGYDNVTIKEWWKNVDIDSLEYGRHFLASSYSLKDHEVIHTDTNVTLPSKKYRKTGKLTLCYNINALQHINNTHDYRMADSSYYGHEYPATIEQFDYSIEEAVIKLYGLKRKLEKEFLPLTTRIIDIVGEADAFYVSPIRHNVSSTTIFSNNSGSTNTFNILGSSDNNFYIEDLRPFGIHANQLPSGDGFVGSSRNGGNPDFIGQYQAAYNTSLQAISVQQTQAPQDYVEVFHEYGVQQLSGYNTNYENGDHYSHITDINDLHYEPNAQYLQMTTGLQNILDNGLQGTGNCNPSVQYTGPQGFDPPYAMTGNSLFAVIGPTGSNCEPWIYYVEANNSNNGNYYLAEFSNYFPNLNSVSVDGLDVDYNTTLPDNEGIPAGALVELQIEEHPALWENLAFSWDSASYVTWNYINLYADNICRIEWEISGPNDFVCNISGLVSQGYSDIGVVLPYIGSYTVRCKIFDWNNNVSVVYRPDMINIYPKEVEFTGWCKMRRNNNQPNDITWNEMTSAMFNGMDRGSFIGQYADTNEIDESMTIYNFMDNGFDVVEDNRGSYFWNNLDVAWQDMDHLNWNSMTITGDIPCYMVIGCFDNSGNPVDSPEAIDAGVSDSLPGKWLEIVDKNNNYGKYRFPNASQSNLNYIADVTRQLNESSDRVLTNFHFSYIWQNHTSDPDLEIPEGYHIIAVSKNHGRLGDVKFAGIGSSNYLAQVDPDNSLHVYTDPDNYQLRFFTNSIECNPNWEDTVCINNITEIPAYTDVNFNYTNCKILGKTNPRWKFTNLNTGTVYNSTNKNYHRMFKEKGMWEVSLTLNDSNGNTYSKSKNILKIV